jgi:hypothetical protein
MPADQHKRPTVYGDNEFVVNYNDAVIYGKDLGLLESNTAWLNDACIHYQFTRLQQTHDPDPDSNPTTAKSILFLDPAVVSFLMHQVQDKDEMLEFIEGYNHFESTNRIFVPINDNMGSQHWQTPGLGSHWSLLLVLLLPVSSSSSPQLSAAGEVTTNTTPQFFHFDSVRGSNHKSAHAVATKLYQAWEMAQIQIQQHVQQHVQQQHPSVQVQRDTDTEQTQTTKEVQVQVHECVTPQQINGYDCGVHVLAAAQDLVDWTIDIDSLTGWTTPTNTNTNTTLTGLRLTDPLERQLQQRMTNRGVFFAERLRAEIAQDIRLRAASVL